VHICYIITDSVAFVDTSHNSDFSKYLELGNCESLREQDFIVIERFFSRFIKDQPWFSIMDCMPL